MQSYYEDTVREIDIADREGLRPATTEELRKYLEFHLFVMQVKGLDAIGVDEDDKGAFVLFLIRRENDPDDARVFSVEQAAQSMRWSMPAPTVYARAKVACVLNIADIPDDEFWEDVDTGWEDMAEEL